MSGIVDESRDDDGMGAPANSWSVMVDYEKAEAIKKLLGIISNSLFKRDDLRLVERKEIRRSSLAQVADSEGLLLYGNVSPVRCDAFLFVLRQFRLHTVSDVLTTVSIGHVIGDDVPHFLLAPLVNCRHTEAMRRWYRAHYAMRCGILSQIQERRQKTKERLENIIRRRHSAREGEADPFNEDFYRGQFRNLTSDNTADEKASRFASLEEYEKATKETKVDMARLAANVPTVFIVWSYRNDACMSWLQTKLFNDDFIKEIRAKTGLAARFATMLDSDPWLHVIEEYLEVPPRKEQDRKNRLDILPEPSKRAQIVLINADTDNREARKAYGLLLMQCRGWSSPEVSLLSLWTGAEGLQSEFAAQFEINVLPFMIATTPCKRNYQALRVSPPQLRFVSTKRNTEEIETDVSGEGTWGALPSSEQDSILLDLDAVLKDPTAALFLSARVDRVHTVVNPYTNIVTRALSTKTSSSITLHGSLTDRLLLKYRRMFSQLWRLRDFRFDGQVVRCSPPIEVVLDPMTPRSYVLGLSRMVTCAVCGAVVCVDKDPHYRCLHCVPREGQLCEQCCSDAARHAEHHIFARIPPCPQNLELEVVWGPSNVLPLSLFCGKIIKSLSDIHISVYCNRCKNLVRGIRWKCAVCFQYDLCHVCYRKTIVKKELEVMQGNNHSHEDHVNGVVTAHDVLCVPNSQGHALSHPLLCIRYGRGGDNNDFLAPQLIKAPLEYLEQPQE